MPYETDSARELFPILKDHPELQTLILCGSPDLSLRRRAMKG